MKDAHLQRDAMNPEESWPRFRRQMLIAEAPTEVAPESFATLPEETSMPSNITRQTSLISRDEYPREDSNTPDSGAKNGDSEKARHKIRHTARTKRPNDGPETSSTANPDLVELIQRWPQLHPATKAHILAFVRQQLDLDEY